MAKPKIKICVVSISLAKGGAERSTAILTKMLQEEGYEVHLVLLTNAIDYEFEGQLFNLGIHKSKTDYPWKRIHRIRKLRKYLKLHQFDYILDNRSRQSTLVEMMYLNYVYRGFKFIYVVRSRNLDKYLTKHEWLSELIVKQAHSIIGVSNDITKTINSRFNTQKATTIYNPVETYTVGEEFSSDPERYILFLGRLDEEVKNLSLLLEAYRQSKLPDVSVNLYLVGDGDSKDFLLKKIETIHLQNHVKLFPFTNNVHSIIKNALFLVLTSRYEGFPRVLIEALSIGTPVVSVDCESGPSEIIENELNGLLVENHNPKALADAFDRFLFDENLYGICKSNSQESVRHLNQKNIVKKWSKILMK